MLKFYTHIHEITPENRSRVFPMLFDWFYLEHPSVKDYFELVTTIEAADVCILALDLGFYLSQNKKHEVDAFIVAAQHHTKKVWIYSGGDFGTTLAADVILFRLGGFHSQMNLNTFVLPSFINDPYTTVLSKKWKPLSKGEKPTIGFVGNADGSLFKWTKEALIYGKQTLNRFLNNDFTDTQSFFPSSSIRFKFLEQLRLSKHIQTDFIYRNKYRAGATTAVEKAKTTLEFYENMERNLYTFCLRGSGNFSVRFYETLMMGRIPVLIDTDVRLPFHQTLAWKTHCVFATPENFIAQLIAFHEQHSNEDLLELQHQNRALALGQLNRQAYFISISKLANVI